MHSVRHSEWSWWQVLNILVIISVQGAAHIVLPTLNLTNQRDRKYEPGNAGYGKYLD